MEILFWAALAVVAYTYVGYPILLYLIVRLKRGSASKDASIDTVEEWPTLALMVAAYNEAPILEEKIQNTLALKYPREKLRIIFITDGSSDTSPAVVRKYPEVELYHEDARRGKNHAINRVVPFVKEEVLVFCDANTHLNADALIMMARHYQQANVGGIAGEKRVRSESGDVASSGESAYWKYESKLKELDSALYTVVGAAGELFSVRRELYEAVPTDIIIEDFYLSMRVVEKGYRVIYEPKAYAYESGSASIGEERKRKVRIAAGGIQAILRLKEIGNIFKFGWATFCYISHRAMRWTAAPLGLLICFVANIFLVVNHNSILYQLTMVAQIAFYAIAIAGGFLQSAKGVFRLLLIPYYFAFMNYCVYHGFVRFLRGKQSAVWEKTRRA